MRKCVIHVRRESTLRECVIDARRASTATDRVLIGGDDANPTWEEYLEPYAPEGRARMEAVRRAIEAAGLVGTCADEWCNEHCFAFPDGVRVYFTWRAWGDLMQAIVGKREGYMAYYMACLRREAPATTEVPRG